MRPLLAGLFALLVGGAGCLSPDAAAPDAFIEGDAAAQGTVELHPGTAVWTLDPATLDYDNELLAWRVTALAPLELGVSLNAFVATWRDGPDACVAVRAAATDPRITPSENPDRAMTSSAPSSDATTLGFLTWGAEGEIAGARVRAAGQAHDAQTHAYPIANDGVVDYQQSATWLLPAGATVEITAGGHDPAFAAATHRYSGATNSIQVVLNASGPLRIDALEPRPLKCGTGFSEFDDVTLYAGGTYLGSATLEAKVALQAQQNQTMVFVNHGFSQFAHETVQGSLTVGGQRYDLAGQTEFRRHEPGGGALEIHVEHALELTPPWIYWFLADADLTGVTVLPGF